MRGTILRSISYCQRKSSYFLRRLLSHFVSARAAILSPVKRHKHPKGRVTGERTVGLARAISKLGYCSRSQASEHIRSGRVTLNGSVTRNPEALVHFGREIGRASCRERVE